MTYDHEGREVSPGHRGASLAVIGEGPHALVLRGRTGGGEIALKIQKESSPWLNPGTDARWRREHQTLSTLGGEEPGLVGLEPVPGFDSEAGPPRFEPLFLCREKGLLFHLPCPRCLRVHVLGDCRDDAALAAAGLPTWSSSKERFVWCTACGREDPVFYVRKERGLPGPIEDLTLLIRGLRSVVDRGRDEEPIPSELLTGLEQDFPCLTCDQRAACYPRGDPKKQGLAEVRLQPVSMNEFYAFPLPLCALRFDEAADLFSGEDAGGLLRRHGKTWNTPALRRLREEAIRGGRPPDPLQALAARLDLCHQAAQCAHRLHVNTGRPHLGLSPAHLLVQVEEGDLPVVRLAAPEAGRPVRGLLLAPPDPLPPYAAPALLDERFGREIQVRIHVQKVWSSSGDTFFSAELHGDGLPGDLIGENDQVRISIRESGWENVEIWGQVAPTDLAEAARGRLPVMTAPTPLPVELVNDLKEARGQKPLFGTAVVYRDHGLAFDVHALGMLFFRALLVNGVQSWERVLEELVLPVSASLELLAANRPDAGLDDFREMLLDELARPPAARLAAPANVWHAPDEVTEDLPREAWFRLLTIAFRAATFIPGFSYLDSDRAEVGEDVGAPTRAILSDLEEVREEVEAALPLAGAVVEEEEEDVVAMRPLSAEEAENITGEIESRYAAEVERLREALEASENARRALSEAWAAFYRGITGLPDPGEPPRDAEDGRVTLLTTTAEESIECITQVFKGIARFGGDELGENVPKIRVMIQDALHALDREGGDPAKQTRRIKRQLKALRMFLFAVVQTFLEAHGHATKLGTRNLMQLLEKGLFEPVVKGRREREPDAKEIQRRFQEIAASLPEKHHRIFQPFFQKYVQEKLKKIM